MQTRHRARSLSISGLLLEVRDQFHNHTERRIRSQGVKCARGSTVSFDGRWRDGRSPLPGGHPAIDDHAGPGHEAGIIGRKKNDAVGDVLGDTETPDRM
jgi:hypothetical protein